MWVGRHHSEEHVPCIMTIHECVDVAVAIGAIWMDGAEKNCRSGVSRCAEMERHCRLNERDGTKVQRVAAAKKQDVLYGS